MTKPAPLTIISSLPVILACALLGATAARAVPYVVTIEPEGHDVIVTSNEDGEFNLNGLNVISASVPSTAPGINPAGQVAFGSGMVDIRNRGGPLFDGPNGFGPDDASFTGASATSGPAVLFARNLLMLPTQYSSGTPLDVSTNTFDDATLASLGITPGFYRWTWGTAQDQSFAIDVVPGPIVGAGLPGLIAALGGLVAMARRRRKQLA